MARRYSQHIRRLRDVAEKATDNDSKIISETNNVEHLRIISTFLSEQLI